MHTHDKEKMLQYDPLTRLVLRSLKHIFYDLDELIKQFLVSVEELTENITDDDKLSYIELMIFYYSQGNREFTEEAINRKVKQLSGKSEWIKNIL